MGYKKILKMMLKDDKFVCPSCGRKDFLEISSYGVRCVWCWKMGSPLKFEYQQMEEVE